MIPRLLINETREAAKDFKIICITGPRQSGKTTLCRQEFGDKPYVSLEDPNEAAQAQQDGRAFLARFKNGAVLDEVQRVPQLFNYLQRVVDEKNRNGQFVLTGSSNFLMQQNISQSLAGRAGYIELLPFSLAELKKAKVKERSLEQAILEGSYPAIVTGASTANRWLDSYIKTYVERDVRMIRNIDNIITFSKFLGLCADRAGQLLNVNNLANEVGVDNKTINSWLGVLESSYILFRLPPYYKNFGKRLIKSPKLYFYDTGVLCRLLGIHTVAGLKKSNHYGAIFENMMLSEIMKNRFNKEQTGKVYFFRDSSGREIDVVLEKEEELMPLEIKASAKTDPGGLNSLKWFQKTFRQQGGILLQGGRQERSFDNEIRQVGWESVAGI